MRAWSTSLERIQKYLFRGLVFLIPVQLTFHFWPVWSFVYGIRIDYFAPSVYPQDLIITALVVIFVLNNIRLKVSVEKVIISLLFLLFLLINLRISLVWQISLVKWVRILELIFLGVIVRFTNLDFEKDFLRPLGFSIIFFTIIGVLQFALQRSVGGPLYFLGERSFNLDTTGIAKIVIVGKNYLRSYSTFSHPNSFAGYLLVGLTLFLLANFKQKENLLRTLTIIFSLVGILISFSLSVYLFTILLTMPLFLRRHINLTFSRAVFLTISSLVVSLLLPLGGTFFTIKSLSESFGQRLFLAGVSEKVIQTHFLFGVGVNNFIIALTKFSSLSNSVWLLQPVHNIFLLTLTETGIVGLILFFLLIVISLKESIRKNQPFLALAILMVCFTGLFDHYWLTLTQNQILFALLISFAIKPYSSNPQKFKML